MKTIALSILLLSASTLPSFGWAIHVDIGDDNPGTLTVHNHFGTVVGTFDATGVDGYDIDEDEIPDFWQAHYEVGSLAYSGSFGYGGGYTDIFDDLSQSDGWGFSTIGDPTHFPHSAVQTRNEAYSERQLQLSDISVGLDGEIVVKFVLPSSTEIYGNLNVHGLLEGDVNIQGSADINGQILSFGTGHLAEARFGWKATQSAFLNQVRNYYQYRLASQSSSKRAIWVWETPLAQGTFTEILKLESDGVNPPSLKLNNANVLTSANIGSSLPANLNITGTVGIGTTSPNPLSKLHVAGSGNAFIVDGNAVFNNGLQAGVISSSTYGTASSPAIKLVGGGFATGFYTLSGNDLQTTVGGQHVMSISPSGHATIGIGNTTEQLTLDGYYGDLSFSDGSVIATSRDTLYFNFYTSRNHDFNDGQITFTSTGKMGIGTTLPNGVLTVASNAVDGAGASSKGILFVSTVLAPASPFTHASIFSDGSSGYNGNLVFATDGDSANNNNPTEKMRILANGNVGVGTAAPQAKLHVVGTMKIDGPIQITRQGDILMGEFGNP